MSCQYTIYPAEGKSPLEAAWESPLWQRAEEAKIAHFHPAGSSHRPAVSARLLYDPKHLYLRFYVRDRYVVSTRTQFQEKVYPDSCVEFFVEPRPSAGYFNFEINCGGTLRLCYIEDPTRTAEGFARFTVVAAEHGTRVDIHHSMPKVVFPELPGPLDWQIACRIPLDVLSAYVGPLRAAPGQVWRGNFYKCADESSHPHWGSWAPIGEKLDFHQPRYFAPLRFAANDEREVL